MSSCPILASMTLTSQEHYPRARAGPFSTSLSHLCMCVCVSLSVSVSVNMFFCDLSRCSNQRKLLCYEKQTRRQEIASSGQLRWRLPAAAKTASISDRGVGVGQRCFFCFSLAKFSQWGIIFSFQNGQNKVLFGFSSRQLVDNFFYKVF